MAGLCGLAGRLVLDLAAVDFMDSQGLNAIISAAQRLRGTVTIRNAPRQVRVLLDVSGLGGLFDVESATPAEGPAELHAAGGAIVP